MEWWYSYYSEKQVNQTIIGGLEMKMNKEVVKVVESFLTVSSAMEIYLECGATYTLADGHLVSFDIEEGYDYDM